jgi:hypothetical protein
MFRPPFLRTSSEVFKHPYQILFILSKKHVNSQYPSSLSRITVKTERSLKDQLLKEHYIIYLWERITNNTYEQTGIYKLTCAECKQVYIGQTGRTLKVRYKEHIRSIKYNKEDSAFATYLKQRTLLWQNGGY